jgi:hypothetical protein
VPQTASSIGNKGHHKDVGCLQVFVYHSTDLVQGLHPASNVPHDVQFEVILKSHHLNHLLLRMTIVLLQLVHFQVNQISQISSIDFHDN